MISHIQYKYTPVEAGEQGRKRRNVLYSASYSGTGASAPTYSLIQGSSMVIINPYKEPAKAT